MDPVLIAQVVFSALTGGAITGVVSWIKFSNALAILRTDVDNQKNQCLECRKLFRDEIISQRANEQQRRKEEKQERTEDTAVRTVQNKVDADTLERRLDEINTRLASIEDYLRMPKVSRGRRDQP
jgi:uncharacterized membrane protein